MKYWRLSLIVACAVGTFTVLAQEGEEGGTEKSANSGKVNAFHSSGPHYTADGELIRPEGWRKWVYVGTPLTPHDMNGGKVSFPEFHNVYVDPESFATFERTGEFANGTQLLKELVLVGSKEAVSGNGYFMGEFAGLEVAVKDTVRLSPDGGFEGELHFDG